MKGAVEAIEWLRHDHSLPIITSRPETIRERTAALVEKHFPPVFDGIHFLNHYRDDGTRSRERTKGEVCKALGVRVFVEDALENAVSVADEGIPVLLFDVPWNQGELPAGITRVFGWRDALLKLAVILSPA